MSNNYANFIGMAHFIEKLGMVLMPIGYVIQSISDKMEIGKKGWDYR